MPNAYYPNNLIRLTGTYTSGGLAADPTTVSLKVKDPAGAVTTYASPVKDSVGNYHQDVTATIVGVWYYDWIGTGAIIAESESTFTILPSQVG